jgi:hypothetical protein
MITRRRCAARSTRVLGWFVWWPTRTGQVDTAAVPDELLNSWSKRTAKFDAEA